jgi:hypothetical protein
VAARDMILTARKKPAQQSVQLGMCERLVAEGTSREQAEQRTAALAGTDQC